MRKFESNGGIRWTPGIPADNGIRPSALNSVCSVMTQEQYHDRKVIVIVRDRHPVRERYFNDDSVDLLHDIRFCHIQPQIATDGYCVPADLIQPSGRKAA
jgi:hypothetical protein